MVGNLKAFVSNISVHNYNSTWQAMASPRPRNWIIRGPPCDICMINSGDPYARIGDRLTTPERNYIQLHHPNLETVCYECTQGIFDERHTRWWMEVFRGHSILTDLTIQSCISKYLWISMHDTVCLCGSCDPLWLTREGLLVGCYLDKNHPGQWWSHASAESRRHRHPYY